MGNSVLDQESQVSSPGGHQIKTQKRSHRSLSGVYWNIGGSCESLPHHPRTRSSPALSAQLVPAGTSAMKTGPAFRPHSAVTVLSQCCRMPDGGVQLGGC